MNVLFAEGEGEGEAEGEAAIDPFLGAPSPPGGWKHPCNGFLLLGSSKADDVAHDTKKGSIARDQEGIKSKGNILDI